MIKPRLSIVIPTLNEEQGLPLLLNDLRAIDASPGFLEVLVVDGGSRDSTRAIAEEFGARVLSAPLSRGGQLQTGFLASQGQMLWFLHADSRVDSTCWEALELLWEVAVGAIRREAGDAPVPLGFRIIARVMNLRSCFTCIATGDQGIFVARELIEQIGGVPEQPLMEDVEISLRLRRSHRHLPACEHRDFSQALGAEWSCANHLADAAAEVCLCAWRFRGIAFREVLQTRKSRDALSLRDLFRVSLVLNPVIGMGTGCFHTW